MGAFGVAITGTMAKCVIDFANTGEQLTLMSQRTGFSVKALSELKFGMERMGGSLESVQTAFRGMSNAIDTATQSVVKAQEEATKASESASARSAGKAKQVQDIESASAQSRIGIEQDTATTISRLEEDTNTRIARIREDASTRSLEKAKTDKVAASKIVQDAESDIVRIEEDLTTRLQRIKQDSADNLYKIQQESSSKITALQTATQEAVVQTSTATESAFSRLGIKLDELKAKKPEDQFYTLLVALSGVSDATQRAALAQDVFGRSALELLPLVADGVTGFEEMKQKLTEVGAAMYEPIRVAIDWIIERINDLIGLINKIPFVNIGEIGFRMPELGSTIAGGSTTTNVTVNTQLDGKTIATEVVRVVGHEISLQGY